MPGARRGSCASNGGRARPQHRLRPQRLRQVDCTPAHRARSRPPAVREPPYGQDMVPSIARVEPLTTARALRGPFDYRIPSRDAGVGVGSVLLVPFGRRRVLGLVVDMAAAQRAAARAPGGAARDARVRRAGRARRARPVGRRRVLLDAGARPGARAAARHRHRPAGGAAARDARAARGRADAGGRRGAAGPRGERGSGRASTRALEPLARRRRRDRELPTPPASRTRRSRASRGAGWCARAARDRAPARPRWSAGGGGRRRRPAAARSPRAQAPRSRRARAAARAPPRRRCCCTASPAAARPRSTCAPPQAALEQGRAAIVLVPEIALTPQTARRFEERFGDRVAVLHSKLGLGERYDEWQRLRSGEARICVGPALGGVRAAARPRPGRRRRGARLRLQAGERPALRRPRGRRAARAAAPARCCSAAARRRAPRAGCDCARLELPERVDDRRCRRSSCSTCAACATRCTPTRAPRSRRSGGAAARRSCSSTAAAGRRSSSAAPAGTPGCARSCDVTLTLHRDGDARALSATTAVTPSAAPAACPECGSTARRAARRRHPAARGGAARGARAAAGLPARRATPRGARAASPRVLRALRAAPAGRAGRTQMVAQGHDFPEVELAVVQDADATLRFPDFRAEERTFALVAQLAGRSGRGPGGRPRAGADAVPATPLPAARRARTTRRLPRGGDRAPPRAALPAVLDADPRRHLRPEQEAADRAAERVRRRCSAASRCSARRRSSGSRTAAARAGREGRRRASRGRGRRRGGARRSRPSARYEA